MVSDAEKNGVELWAGIECTLNRIGERYFDQCAANGHDRRMGDLECFAELGIRTIRYPALWEKAAPLDPGRPDWSGIAPRFERMRELGLTPIAGLLHHGSGPRYTGLTDPDFAGKFARYAAQFARRFPWVGAYTPVNEPLTTARFSGLYGHWYPHARDDLAFLRILLNELRATVLAMRAIREVNPEAKLVQTEDLGKATGTRALAYQVELENHRRWLTFDFLCGRVDAVHPFWEYFLKAGGKYGELAWFLDNPFPPDVIGINHYLLSNRFLDHRLDLYPSRFHGGNGRDRYADVGAVDSALAKPPPPREILRETWERYRLPFAVTEVHLNGPRESQMRWLHEVWRAARRLRREGCDIRAVTAWSLLGSFDWNSLCTACDGFYEAGVFDIRGPKPRRTGLAKMAERLAREGEFRHPVLAQSGWWHDPSRRLYARSRLKRLKPKSDSRFQKGSRPLLITGATGTLGGAFARICRERGLDYRLLCRGEMDIAEAHSVEAALQGLKPWAVINTAGYVKVDRAEAEPERCYRENAHGAQILARACAESAIPLVTFSTDLVFNGAVQSPYMESHAVDPINIYGKSKAEAEKRVLSEHADALIIRTSSFFGPWDESNFIVRTLRQLARQQEVPVVKDRTVTPTYVPDLVHASLDLLVDGASGVWHLTNDGALTWMDFARMAAKLARQDCGRLIGCHAQDYGFTAPRPAYSALGSERAKLLPSVDGALARFFSESAFLGGRAP